MMLQSSSFISLGLQLLLQRFYTKRRKNRDLFYKLQLWFRRQVVDHKCSYYMEGCFFYYDTIITFVWSPLLLLFLLFKSILYLANNSLRTSLSLSDITSVKVSGYKLHSFCQSRTKLSPNQFESTHYFNLYLTRIGQIVSNLYLFRWYSLQITSQQRWLLPPFPFHLRFISSLLLLLLVFLLLPLLLFPVVFILDL